MRFRKRVKLFPGVHLNFSAKGISTTIGVPGLSVNLSNKGTYLNTGIPGTGLYDRQKLGGQSNAGKFSLKHNPEPFRPEPHKEDPPTERTEIKSVEAAATTTEGLMELKKMLLDCYNTRKNVLTAIPKALKAWKKAKAINVISKVLILGFFVGWFKKNCDTKKEQCLVLEDQLENCFVDISIDLEKTIDDKYTSLLHHFGILIKCNKIWDITSSASVNRITTRSSASIEVTRQPVRFGLKNMDIIRSAHSAMHLENANGGDLYFYPAFVAIVDSQKRFGLIDISDLHIDFKGQQFVEHEPVPEDASVVSSTWAKVNKNGTPDRRFKGNYEIPICYYGEIRLSSTTGLNEAYAFSSFDKAKEFADALQEYQAMAHRQGNK